MSSLPQPLFRMLFQVFLLGNRTQEGEEISNGNRRPANAHLEHFDH